MRLVAPEEGALAEHSLAIALRVREGLGDEFGHTDGRLMSDARRSLPSVDRVLADERLQRAAAELGIATTTAAVRDELAAVRATVSTNGAVATFDAIAVAAVRRAYAELRASLRPVMNATGVIIHTNLGRAPLSDDAVRAMAEVSTGYSNLEFDLDSGERGSRHTHVAALLRRLTGAEDAIAVNNNAAAVLLVLSALAAGREVVISRGQLVEIGGGFRIPDVMAQGGARLVEVGTTNRTYAADYESAAGEGTAALMRVHPSNFRVVGFVESVSADEMARIAHARGLLFLDDLGSGCLLDTRPYGLAREPTPAESLAAGADLVMFSGDKLLGGPQAGIIAGRAELVARLRRHPLARAIRMDKASIAALVATLRHYARGEAEREVPVWKMIAMPAVEARRRAHEWAAALGEGAGVVEGRTMVGGGSLPEESLPTSLLAVSAAQGAETLARALRTGEPAVVARIEGDRVVFDPRTIDPRHDARLVDAIRAALEPTRGS